MRPPTVRDSAFARIERDFREIEPSRRAEARRLLAPEVQIVRACEYYDEAVVDPLTPAPLQLDPDGCPSARPVRRHRLYFEPYQVKGVMVSAVYSRRTDTLYVRADHLQVSAIPHSELTLLALAIGSR